MKTYTEQQIKEGFKNWLYDLLTEYDDDDIKEPKGLSKMSKDEIEDCAEGYTQTLIARIQIEDNRSGEENRTEA